MKKLAAVFLAVAAFLHSAETPAKPAWGKAADNKIFAQQLVSRLVAQEPKLLTAGMHCVAPDGTAMTIIASTLDVIGKPSDPNDVDVGERGFTLISPNPPKAKIGVMMPLHDHSGKLIGALALAFKYRDGDDQAKYFAEAIVIRDRVAQEIPDLAALFAKTP